MRHDEYLRREAERKRLRRAANRHAGRFKHRFGLSKEEYLKIVEAQDSKCLICQEVPSHLAVDHDHDTGEFRGLLCRRCNTGLGLFLDDPKRLIAAARYLLRNSGGSTQEALG